MLPRTNLIPHSKRAQQNFHKRINCKEVTGKGKNVKLEFSANFMNDMQDTIETNGTQHCSVFIQFLISFFFIYQSGYAQSPRKFVIITMLGAKRIYIVNITTYIYREQKKKKYILHHTYMCVMLLPHNNNFSFSKVEHTVNSEDSTFDGVVSRIRLAAASSSFPLRSPSTQKTML